MPPSAVLLPLHRWCRLTGIAPITAWRYRKRGWLRTVNICGRVYVTAEAIHAFMRRAEAGEFALTPEIARRHRRRCGRPAADCSSAQLNEPSTP